MPELYLADTPVSLSNHPQLVIFLYPGIVQKGQEQRFVAICRSRFDSISGDFEGHLLGCSCQSRFATSLQPQAMDACQAPVIALHRRKSLACFIFLFRIRWQYIWRSRNFQDLASNDPSERDCVVTGKQLPSVGKRNTGSMELTMYESKH